MEMIGKILTGVIIGLAAVFIINMALAYNDEKVKCNNEPSYNIGTKVQIKGLDGTELRILSVECIPYKNYYIIDPNGSKRYVSAEEIEPAKTL